MDHCKQEEERDIRVKAGGPGEMHNDNVTAKCCRANDDRVHFSPFSGIHLCVHIHMCRFMNPRPLMHEDLS